MEAREALGPEPANVRLQVVQLSLRGPAHRRAGKILKVSGNRAPKLSLCTFENLCPKSWELLLADLRPRLLTAFLSLLKSGTRLEKKKKINTTEVKNREEPLARSQGCVGSVQRQGSAEPAESSHTGENPSAVKSQVQTGASGGTAACLPSLAFRKPATSISVYPVCEMGTGALTQLSGTL